MSLDPFHDPLHSLHECNTLCERSTFSARNVLMHQAKHSPSATPIRSAAPLCLPVQMSPAGNGQITAAAHHEDGVASLARAINESINASRLLLPKPAVFSGDPLRDKDWKMSFQMLIDRKNIHVSEKLYHLRKYVSGLAKKAIDGYFLLGIESAYHTAWKIPHEWYRNSFVIAKAFRDTLYSWPKIGP